VLILVKNDLAVRANVKVIADIMDPAVQSVWLHFIHHRIGSVDLDRVDDRTYYMATLAKSLPSARLSPAWKRTPRRQLSGQTATSSPIRRETSHVRPETSQVLQEVGQVPQEVEQVPQEVCQVPQEVLQVRQVMGKVRQAPFTSTLVLTTSTPRESFRNQR
jgi:hypothetical protein